MAAGVIDIAIHEGSYDNAGSPTRIDTGRGKSNSGFPRQRAVPGSVPIGGKGTTASASPVGEPAGGISPARRKSERNPEHNASGLNTADIPFLVISRQKP